MDLFQHPHIIYKQKKNIKKPTIHHHLNLLNIIQWSNHSQSHTFLCKSTILYFSSCLQFYPKKKKLSKYSFTALFYQYRLTFLTVLHVSSCLKQFHYPLPIISLWKSPNNNDHSHLSPIYTLYAPKFMSTKCHYLRNKIN